MKSSKDINLKLNMIRSLENYTTAIASLRFRAVTAFLAFLWEKEDRD